MQNSTLTTWTRLQASAWIPALAWLAWTARAEDARAPIAVAAGLSVLSLAIILRAPRTLADVVTLTRAAVVVGAVASPWWIGDQPWVTWSLLAGASAFDLVDGALARMRGATEHGAALDMEADQLSVLAMAVMVVCAGGSALALALPSLRYAYVLAAWPARIPSSDPKPRDGDNRRAKYVCAAVVVVLLLALLPLTPLFFVEVMMVAAVGLLSWSFAGDWVFLLRRRGAEARS